MMDRIVRISALLAGGLFVVACASTQTQDTAQTDVGATRHISRSQSETTPFEHIKKKFTMHKGPTYLGFIQDEVFPAQKSFIDVYDEEEKQFPKKFLKWQTDWLASGDGTAVRIDDDNYFFNLGYRDGNKADDPKSGRSYGVGPTKAQSDPSYQHYLDELEKYYEGKPKETSKFLRALLMAIVQNDPSGWSELSEQGQTVATDFLAIYTAESMRHNMVKLKPRVHQWEIDLASVTFISPFVVNTGYMLDDSGKWAKQSITEFTQTGDNGGGVGMTHRQREKMTSAIADHLKKDKDAAKARKEIEDVTGDLEGDDPIQGVFTYLNNPKSPDKLSDSDANKLIDGLIAYIEVVNKIEDHKDVEL
jgi:hypothetical protein